MKYRIERGQLDQGPPLQWLVYSGKVRQGLPLFPLQPEAGSIKATATILDAGYGPFESVLGHDGQSEELIVGQPFQRRSNTISLEAVGDPKS